MTFKDDFLLDETGWNILRELQRDARQSFPELGRRVGLSSPAVAERVRKLEDAGVITGYGARINPAKVGLPMMAFVRLTTTPMSETGLHTFITDLPELLECHRVTGNESFLLKLVVTSISHLERVLNQLMNYGPVATSIVLSTPRSGAPLKQEAASGA
ncbi:Lrp/AsnC family transcriptional regulator [Ktedonobacter racemifer]|uniref:Transcriptional regulator, AsnC family n=1 Tax=Ktedonobacter racemifer DSM 44963 TaxID=485913 RepID=D6TTV0_KTERA|nr:Lrp/AsnC family transcriptional regulator [Ktedonobacter racemifer]EFH83851.1 transcriptional regulator, AsnC family [Ktedonobacter racemifer DSM 44963]